MCQMFIIVVDSIAVGSTAVDSNTVVDSIVVDSKTVADNSDGKTVAVYLHVTIVLLH